MLLKKVCDLNSIFGTAHNKGRIARYVLVFAAIVLSVIASQNTAFGQTDQGAITGTVGDATGAAIPGATVVLTNVDTGLVLSGTSDSSGVYTFAPVKIGHYSVKVSSPGFGTSTQTDIELHVQQRLELNVSLKLGGLTETVEVTTGAGLMQTQDASVGQQLTTEAINSTPLNGRNFVYIAQLSTGVTPVTSSRGGGTGDFSANGQRATMNNFILDGVDNNASLVDFASGSSYIVRPPPDALQEFKVQTANYSSEFGHSAGAVVNASLRSGTNEIHGSVWEYFRNTHLNAKDWNFAAIPPYHQNQFGATLGFPIIKNKLFFFGDFEDLRVRAVAVNNSLTVAPKAFRVGDFSSLLDPTAPAKNQLYNCPTAVNANCTVANSVKIPNNILGGLADPVALRLLALLPCPDVTVLATNNCQVNRKINDNTFQWDARLDWNMSAKDQAFARFSYSNERRSIANPCGAILDCGIYNDSGNSGFLGENVALSETHLFSNTLTNDLRFGYNYGTFTILQTNPNTNISAQLGLGGIPYTPLFGGLPLFNNFNIAPGITGSQFGTPGFEATVEHQNIGQLLDNVTKVSGNHTIKAGVSFLYIRFATLQPNSPRGNFQYSGLYSALSGGAAVSGVADMLLNRPAVTAITNTSQSDQIRWDSGAFIQDDWKIRKDLTLNVGVRWEDPTMYRDLHGRQSNLAPTSALAANSGTANLLIPISAGTNPLPPNFSTLQSTSAGGSFIYPVLTNNGILVNNSWKNFAPRLGIAYQPTDRLVIRAGYGIFHSGIESTGYGPNIGSNYPFLTTSNFTAAGCAATGCQPSLSNKGNPITLETGFTDPLGTTGGLIAAATSPTMNAVEPHTKVPYTENYNFGAQYRINDKMSIWAGYVGSESHKMLLSKNINLGYTVFASNDAKSVNQTRAFQAFGNVAQQQYAAQSNYNSLQVSLQQQNRKGLNFSANYTYSHGIGIGNSLIGGGGVPIVDNPNIPVKSRINVGDLSFDVRHRFAFNGSYELPFGKGHHYLANSGIGGAVLGGWQVSGTYTIQTGSPLSITATGAGTAYAAPIGAPGTLYATLVGDPFKGGGTANATNPSIACPAQVKTRANWYNPCAFANPLNSRLATTAAIPAGTGISGAAVLPYLGGRPAQIHGPGNNRANMALFKNIPIYEHYSAQFRADIFNVLNHPTNANPSVLTIGTNGGQISTPVAAQKNTPDSRFFQFSLKLLF